MKCIWKNNTRSDQLREKLALSKHSKLTSAQQESTRNSKLAKSKKEKGNVITDTTEIFRIINYCFVNLHWPHKLKEIRWMNKYLNISDPPKLNFGLEEL